MMFEYRTWVIAAGLAVPLASFGSGAELVREKCGGCHSLTISGVELTGPGAWTAMVSAPRTTAEWESTITRMMKISGSAVTPPDIPVIASFLAGIGAQSAPVPAPTDAGQLATAQYCGLCHGLTVDGATVTLGAIQRSAGQRDAAAWLKTVNRMKIYGCPVPAGSEQPIAGYLASLKHQAPVPIPTAIAPPPPPEPPAAPPAADAPVSPEPAKPLAVIRNAPSAVTTGDVVLLDGSLSSDPDGRIVSYQWAASDGTTATGATFSHAFGAPCHCEVTLTVTDNDGHSAQISTTFEVKPLPPSPSPAASPPENISGEAAAKQYCVICHGLKAGNTVVTDGATQQVVTSRSVDNWRDTIVRMRAGGCPVPPHADQAIAEYLAGLTPVAAATPALPQPPEGEALARQACGTCHGLQIGDTMVAQGAVLRAAPPRDVSAWMHTIIRMKGYGGPIPAGTERTIAEYLAGLGTMPKSATVLAEDHARQYCGTCHGLTANGVVVTAEVPRASDVRPGGNITHASHDAGEWRTLISKRHADNADLMPGDDAITSQIAEYLAALGAPARIARAAIPATAGKPAPVTPPAALDMCGICHGLVVDGHRLAQDVPADSGIEPGGTVESTRRDRSGWETLVKDMIDKGCPMTEDSATYKTIVKYLSTHFGKK